MQKTSNEMRISDWSSDVCASDLRREMWAPIRCRKSASSTTSGSVAALAITVRPSASTADSSTVSVAPTEGYGSVILAPRRRPDIRAVIPWGCTSISAPICCRADTWKSRSEEHTSELQSLMRISYAVFCLKQKNTTCQKQIHTHTQPHTHHYKY